MVIQSQLYFIFLAVLICTCLGTTTVKFSRNSNERINNRKEKESTFMSVHQKKNSTKFDQKVEWAFNDSLKEIPFLLDKSPFEATQETFQHMALITVRSGDDMIRCSGSILDNRRVLTAAHCFFTKDGKLDLVDTYLVPSTLTGEAVDGVILVKNVHVLKTFENATLQNDIAVVTILGSFSEGQFRNVSIPTDIKLFGKNKTEIGQLYVSGYGIQEINREGFLEQVPFNLEKTKKCKKRFRKAIKKSINKSEMLCTVQSGLFQNGSSICFGDSGGSLFYQMDDGQMMQIGVASFTEPGCGVNGSTGWYTNTATYLEFIEEHKSNNFTSWSEIYDFGF